MNALTVIPPYSNTIHSVSTRTLALLITRLEECTRPNDYGPMFSSDHNFVVKVITAAKWLSVMITETPEFAELEELERPFGNIFAIVTVQWSKDPTISIVQLIEIYTNIQVLIDTAYKIQDQLTRRSLWSKIFHPRSARRAF